MGVKKYADMYYIYIYVLFLQNYYLGIQMKIRHNIGRPFEAVDKKVSIFFISDNVITLYIVPCPFLCCNCNNSMLEINVLTDFFCRHVVECNFTYCISHVNVYSI